MDPDFRFDPDGSDDEAAAAAASARRKPAQSPWEFSTYAQSVAAEHASRRTTSIDEKISQALRGRRNPSMPDGSEDEEEEEDAAAADDDSQDEAVKAESGDEEDELEDSDDDDDESDGGEEEVDEDESGEEDGEEEEEEEAAQEDDDTPEQSGTPDPSKFFASSEGASFSANSFLELNLSRPLVRACEALGYQKPTPIQAACIPLALTGRDICGSAITGSGKTAAFSLPVLERLLFRPKRIPAIRVLILTPTRELAAQVHSMIEKLAQFTDIRCCLIVGGLPTKVQEVALRSNPDIVVATPGRIIDHLRNSLSVGLEDLAILILDEADRLLELGFSVEINELIRMCPKRRQTMLFSATMTEQIDELVKLSLNKPIRLEADPSLKRPATLTEEVVRIRRSREANQEAVLLALCLKTFKERVIIFSGTKHSAHRLKIMFGLSGMKAAELHGNLTQAQRLEALEQFKKQEADILIATDIAARGIDIVGVRTVINFACPRDVTTYLHRVGRTARAGREGYAVTFVTDDDRSLLKAIAKKAGSQLKSRIVAEKPVADCAKLIEQLEHQISNIILEEREEMALRKAEMEATKAENMIAHKDEIYSRPKRTWFATEKEKKTLAKAAKESMGQVKSGSGVSAQQAEDLRLKEKRRREREKNLPRKKRRKLEAQREMLEDDRADEEEAQESEGGKKAKNSQSVVDVAYRRAKSMKATGKKGIVAVKGKNEKKAKQPSDKGQTRQEEMHELFQNDMSEWKQGRALKKKDSSFAKKSKNSFKSKSRYKRRK
ncbi:DEAD-box ATP-dependent RNA helicase 28-like [Lolium rigidum]|uniref:DEAD-box ATP-dependent RNA helicase 28-like n=1 Tax=Lolium rigidum TaxID=89674 RepID=UPI001F5C2204|nr:DEAD-box ATP-dependent RNA helicase 28-like [Lolium rigidum]